MTLNKRILVIEDNHDTLDTMAEIYILGILKEPSSARPFNDPVKALRDRGVDVATTYTEAETYIQQNHYYAVFLDHNLPKAKNRFSENIGYSLIPVIRDKNPNVLIVGTSSMPSEELRKFDPPDHQIKKAGEELEIILKDIFSDDLIP